MGIGIGCVVVFLAACGGVDKCDDLLTSRLDSEDIVVGPITDAVSVLGEE